MASAKALLDEKRDEIPRLAARQGAEVKDSGDIPWAHVKALLEP